MASNKKIITLGMDYSDFEGGVTEVNRKMGVLDSQFKLATEQVKAYGTENDKLTLKQEALTQKINLQTQKVKLSKDAYDSALVSGKATDKQLDNLLKTYNGNQTALQKLNNELADNDTAMQKADKTTQSFGDSIRGMASSLGLQVSPAVEAVASKFDGFNKDVGNAIVGVGAIITTFASFTISAANMADDLLTLSSVTGITTEELQKMEYASKFLDVEVSTITGSMTKLTRNMDDARNGTTELEKTFEKLRVRYKETNGELRNSQDVFYETIDALGKVKNETERDALAMTLLGKSAKDLNPLIAAGSERLKELGIEAENMGTVMDENSLAKLGQMKDAMDKLENTTGALKNSLGLALLPILVALFEAIGAIPTPVLQTIVVLATVITSILLIVKAIKSVTGTAGEISKFFSGVNPSVLKTTAIIMGIVAALIALAIAIAAITGKSADLQNSMTATGDAVGQMTSTVSNAQQQTVKSVGYASGTTNAVGGLTWVGDGGKPELIDLPKGSRVYSGNESEQLASGDNITINLNVKASEIDEINKIFKLMDNIKQTSRQGRINLG